jgi:hypothetical protein
MLAILHPNNTTSTCIGQLEQHCTNINDPSCVALPKLTYAYRDGVITVKKSHMFFCQKIANINEY